MQLQHTPSFPSPSKLPLLRHTQFPFSVSIFLSLHLFSSSVSSSFFSFIIIITLLIILLLFFFFPAPRRLSSNLLCHVSYSTFLSNFFIAVFFILIHRHQLLQKISLLFHFPIHIFLSILTYSRPFFLPSSIVYLLPPSSSCP